MNWENVKQNSSGNYFGKCIHCGCRFIGEKRDFSCDDYKVSDEQAYKNWKDYCERFDRDMGLW